jgi:hypothetical protein
MKALFLQMSATFAISVICLINVSCMNTKHHQSLKAQGNALGFELRLSPQPYSLSHISAAKMLLCVTNHGKKKIDAEPSNFQLLINGEPSLIWMLALGNRMYDPKWFALPSQETMEQDLSSLLPRLFAAKGSYQLQLHWDTIASEIVNVEVVE